MGRLANKVALVTGAARGQGRSHALRLAEEGADIIALDICRQIDTVPYELARDEDLRETARLVEKLGRRVVAREADVRDFDQVNAAVTDGRTELGGLDIVIANAGVISYATSWEMSEQAWRDTLDVNLTGVWHTAKAAIPSMIEQRAGSIVMTGSIASIRAFPNSVSYVAAKHGLLGVMRALAVELAPHMIRVNAVLPTNVNTAMIHNPTTYDLFCPGQEAVTPEDFASVCMTQQLMPIPWAEPADVSNAVAWLASEEARFVTGAALPVDGGALHR